MKNFVTYIKKYPTRDFLYLFSKLSIIMHKKQLESKEDEGIPCSMVIETNTLKYGFGEKKVPVLITAWDIHDIAYQSIINSTDYRNGNLAKEDVGYLVNLYRAYDNLHSGNAFKRDIGHHTNPFTFIAGMTYEQFKMQNLAWIFQSFNRNYHMFIGSETINRDGLKDINEITKEKFGLSVDEYLMIEFTIWWLCSKDPAPLSAPEMLYRKKENSILTKENLRKVVEFYSITYKGVYESNIGKQCFYSKPFVLTNKTKEHIAISIYLIELQIADTLYWLMRDYYRQDGQRFPNKFGEMFEDYFKEIASYYLPKNVWHKIPEGNTKRADFFVEFEDVVFLFELKSGIMSINAKQQNPDVNQINEFVARNIKEAYTQLCNSEKEYTGKKRVIKVFLLYEMIMNEHIIKLTLPDIFEKDSNCHIMTIQELEWLFAIYKSNNDCFQKIIKELAEGLYYGKGYQTIGEMIGQYDIADDLHFIGERDYWKKIMKKWVVELDETEIIIE